MTSHDKHSLLQNKILLFLILLFGSFFLSFHIKAHHSIPKVLFISSYSESFESVPNQIKGIQEVLDSNGILYDIEYMDTKRLNTEKNIELFYTTLKYKLSSLPPYDGIIVGDDTALEFVTKYQEELFYKLPITFLGINDFQRAHTARENPYMTGIIEEASLEDIINIALTFNPKATKVVGLVENSSTGLGDKKQFYLHEDLFPQLHFDDLNISDYTFDEMAQKLEEIEDNTILLFLSMYTDKVGEFYTMKEAAQFLAKHSPVPVYRATIGGIGDGILGGKMISYEEAGRIAAQMMVDVFNGTPIETIPLIENSPNFYIFDYNIIQKYNIDKNLIPEDAILINQKISFYQQNKNLVIGILITIIVLTIISLILTIDNIRHRMMEKKLLESHEELSATYEELSAIEEELRIQYNSAQKHALDIKILNQKYENAILGTDSVVWEVDLKTGKVSFSNNLENLFQISPNQFSSLESILQCIPDKSARYYLVDHFRKYRDNEIDYINVQFPITMPYDTIKWISIRGKGITEEDKLADTGLHILHGILTDTTKAKEQEEHINHLAHHDYLTGLPNRVAFADYLKNEMSKGLPLVLALMDIDDFKSINDTMGHIHGDKILKEVADRLNEFKSFHVSFSRFGGDEFTILISNWDSSADTKITAIMNRLKEPMLIDQVEHYVKYSLGITYYPDDSEDMTQLLMNADTAMYKAKHNGKNQHLFYNTQMQEEVREKERINQILRNAVKNDGFFLVYHPQVSVKTGEIIGFEALLRLKENFIPPNIFISIAEETDLIFYIGRLVTMTAIKQAALWKEQGHVPKIISINFSSKQIKDKGYLSYLKSTLSEYQIEPEYIQIEITESILMEESDDTLIFLEHLKALGVKIAMDDFGTGFSSINYLSYIPVDNVKLDKSLCDKFLGYKDDRVIKNIISLVHSFDIEIIAEGIEEMGQYEQLKSYDCDIIQGYLFSKPLPAEEAEKIYDKNFLQDKTI